MLTKSSLGSGSKQRPRNTPNLDASIFAGLFPEDPRHRELNDLLNQGLRPVLDALNAGTMTQDQASVVIELFLAAYVGAAVNLNVENLVQSWLEGVMAEQLVGESGRR